MGGVPSFLALAQVVSSSLQEVTSSSQLEAPSSSLLEVASLPLGVTLSSLMLPPFGRNSLNSHHSTPSSYLPRKHPLAPSVLFPFRHVDLDPLAISLHRYHF